MVSNRTMTELRRLTFWGLVTFFWTLSRGDTEVSCVFSEICILNCSIQPDSNPVINWTHLAAESYLVHSFSDGKDKVEHQNQNFRGRTSLFGDQVHSGNASLLLTAVKVQDQGRYECKSRTAGRTALSFITVTVDAPVKRVTLQQAGNRITCSSDGIYPEPNLTWTTVPPSNVLLRSSTTVQRTNQQLYNISSSLLLPDSHPNLTYSCTVRTRRNSSTAPQGSPEKTEKTHTSRGIAIVAGVILVAVLMIPLPFLSEKFKKFWESRGQNQREISITEVLAEREPITSQRGDNGDVSLGEMLPLHPPTNQDQSVIST
uniref:V-set domain-containing T-cell activation inhibitor 1 n=1 Tax=Fundulus heteroclitus TaxID=8078 RepID=A0A3Q2PDS7_FUNHE